MISIYSDLNLLTSRVRGDEITNYLKGKRNPPEPEGVCIYLKPRNLDKVKDGWYVDFLDGGVRYGDLAKRPKIKVIAASEASYEELKAKIPNPVVLIPCHHINHERAKRTRTEVTTCGYIGSPSPLATKIYEEIAQELKQIGFEFTTCFNYHTREDAVSLYMGIDLFVIAPWDDKNIHKIPTKIINAASFGIPTIAYPMAGYKEIEDYYVKAMSNKEIVEQAMLFKDKEYYQKWVDKILPMAEKYHIENIIKLYQEIK